MKLEYIVNTKNKYVNIYQVMKEYFCLSNRLIFKLRKNNKIYLNNSAVLNINQEIIYNDVIYIYLDFEETCDNIMPTKMNLTILYEDDSLLIVDKPPFMPVHPSINHFEDSLSNGIKYYFNLINLNKKIRPINRLDKNTSGIVLFAKNEYVQECLIKQMKSNTFIKEYTAIIKGIVNFKEKTIIAPIARKENSIIERCISPDGVYAKTLVKLFKSYENYSIVNCILETGRTHQIRVHMKYINHPILGDDLYGEKSTLINRQALHSSKVKFIHPINKSKIEITSNLPDDMRKLIFISN